MSFEKAERTFTAPPTGLTLIEGRNLDEGDSNGAGKSTVWDAVSWCLFGETVRGVKGDAVINRKHKQDCGVVVTLTVGADTFKVARFRGHTGKDVNGATCGNRLKVHYFPDEAASGGADEVVEKGSIEETQRWLLSETGVDFDLFRCTVLFAQGETFNFVDETDKKQKEILSKIKRLNVDQALIRARKELLALADRKIEAARKIEVLESHQVDPAKAFEAEIAEWEDEQKASLASLSETLETLQIERKRLEAKAEDREKLEAAREGLKKLRDERFAKRGELLSHHKRPLEDRLAVIRARLRTIAELINPTCPTCDQPIDVKAIKAEKKKLTDALEAHSVTLERIALAEKKIDVELATIDEKITTVRDRLREDINRSNNAEKLDGDIKRWQEVKTSTATAVNPWIAKRAEAAKKQEQIATKITELQQEIHDVAAREPYVRFWEVGFSDKGLKSFVFDTICATLTKRANYYLSILSGGVISVAFDTQTRLKSGEMRERFECLVMADGEAVSYAAYSGGEKTRISLAVDMALADLMCDHYGSRFNVVVFDEQDLYLDRQGRQHYMALLKERAKTQRVFVVAHDAEFKGTFDESWIVQKEGKVSSFL